MKFVSRNINKPIYVKAKKKKEKDFDNYITYYGIGIKVVCQN